MSTFFIYFEELPDDCNPKPVRRRAGIDKLQSLSHDNLIRPHFNNNGNISFLLMPLKA